MVIEPLGPFACWASMLPLIHDIRSSSVFLMYVVVLLLFVVCFFLRTIVVDFRDSLTKHGEVFIKAKDTRILASLLRK